MRALKANHTPQAPRVTASPPAASEEPSVRAARDDDVGGLSEVTLLHRYLEAEFAEPAATRRLPLAVSFPIITALSAGLWFGVAACARALLGG
jgi:hypothetical protein